MTEKLIEIFQKETGIKDLPINKDTVLRTDLKINSYDFVQIICAIEDEFDILQWWKLNAPKYPTLARLTRDVLAVPVSRCPLLLLKLPLVLVEEPYPL